MSFQSYSDSLHSKLHLGGRRLPILVALTACVLVVAVVVIWQFVSTAFSSEFVVSKESGRSEEGISTEQQESTSTIVVHVAGAVVSPGICELPQGSRVNDAIVACGGFAEGAATDALNLARVLSDGEQLIIPLTDQNEESSSGTQASSASSQTQNAKVNINTATLEELDSLPGVGESTAQKIIDDRSANGPFTTLEDLKRVSGIGDKKFSALEDYICIG